MGLKKWLHLSQGATADVDNDLVDMATEVAAFPLSPQSQWRRPRPQQEPPRRHTTSTVPHEKDQGSTYSSRSGRNPRVSFTPTNVPPCNTSDTRCSRQTARQALPWTSQLDADEDSDVSIGTDDDAVDDRSNDTSRGLWQSVAGARAKAASGSKPFRRTCAGSTKGSGHAVNGAHPLLYDDTKGVTMHGWLEKCGQQFKTWKWRFFVLGSNGVLAYYTDETLKRRKGVMNVRGETRADVAVQAHVLDKAFVFLVATSQRHLMVAAPSQPMLTKWVARLQAAGAEPTEPWDPLQKTVKFYVREKKVDHEWKQDEDVTAQIQMEGCLLKRGHVNKSWRLRFFRIEKGELRYYTENQSVLKGSMPLADTVVSPGMAQCPDGRKYYFVLTSNDGKFEMHLNARDEKSMHLWIGALQEAQAALGGRTKAGQTDAVAGFPLVLKRAEEIPLGKISVVFQRLEDISIEMQKRTEALIVAYSPDNCAIAVGSQLLSIGGRSILRTTCAEARKHLRASSFPLQLEFLLPPYKRGVLIKKSRSGFENWKKRVVIVANGEIRYYKQVLPLTEDKTTLAELEHRKSFSLYGCYLNLVQMSGREMCIVVARSPSDKLVLETRSEEERMDWASVIYCSIRMVSQGITSGLIENLQLEKPRRPTK